MARRKNKRKAGLSNRHQNACRLLSNDNDIIYRHAIELAQNFLQSGQLYQAEVIFNKVIAADPSNADAYRLLGLLAHEKGDHDIAVLMIQKSLILNPNVAETYCNLATAQRPLGHSHEAIINCRKALYLDPHSSKALNILGGSLLEQRKIPEAITCLEKAVSLNRNNANYRCDLGIALHENNRDEKAISCFRKALEIDPNFEQAHVELEYLLRSQGQNNPEQEISTIHRMIKKISPEPIKVLDNSNVVNSINAMENCIALITLGRAGSMFFHSLFDGHPEIWTTPGITFKGYFEKATWPTISGQTGPTSNYRNLIDSFCDHFEILFNAKSEKAIIGNPMTVKENLGFSSGLTSMGKNGEHALSLDKKAFKNNLLDLLSNFKQVDDKILFQLMHMAYDKTLNLQNQKNALFYHFHVAQPDAFIRFLGLFKNARFIQIIREPVQCLESWIYTCFPKGNHAQSIEDILKKNKDASLLQDKSNLVHLEGYDQAANYVEGIFSGCDNFMFNFAPAMIVRLEDVKRRPREIMPVIANWIGVEDDESLYTPTFQGQYYQGPKSSLHPQLKGFETTNIDRDLGVLFSKRDQFIFKTLLYPARVRFGYQQPDPDGHKKNLKTVETLLDEPLDFEVNLYNSLQGISTPLKGLRQYRYLHNLLKSQFKSASNGHCPNERPSDEVKLSADLLETALI